MNYTEYKRVRYYSRNDFLIVGNNSTVGSALASNDVIGELVIPRSVNGKRVLEIGFNAFRLCTRITKITIYAKITRINDGAFCECTSLTYLNIPETCTYIGNSALFLGINAGAIEKQMMIVEFNQGRTEGFNVGVWDFSRRASFYIIYPSSIAPTFPSNEGLFSEVSTIVICTPIEINFCGIQTTTDTSKCPAPIFKEQLRLTCACKNRQSGLNLFGFILLLLS